ncbi:MAG: MerR family transcriptional regulator [Coriobacteriales bacterium]|jgi:DNA-binding transcriptional MerR regulator
MAETRRYTIGELAEMSGTSTRALRHYEDMGLLAPTRDTNGYRTYSAADARKLAQILSMRACGLPLPTIRDLFDDPDVDVLSALKAHLDSLRAQGQSLADAMQHTKTGIAKVERIEGMDTKDAFEAMKAERLSRNEEAYGEEARERHGDEAVDEANERLMSLTRDEWDAKELLEESIKVQLRLAMAQGDPSGKEAAELARMHARWIRIHWGDSYTKEAHLGLAHGYLCDERFRTYYDEPCGKGATEFLVATLEANLS